MSLPPQTFPGGVISFQSLVTLAHFLHWGMASQSGEGSFLGGWLALRDVLGME